MLANFRDIRNAVPENENVIPGEFPGRVGKPHQILIPEIVFREVMLAAFRK